MDFLFKRHLVVLILFSTLAALYSLPVSADDSDNKFKEASALNVVKAFQSDDLAEIEKVLSLKKLGYKVAPKLFDKRSDINGFVEGFTLKESRERFIASSFSGILTEGTRVYYRSLREMNGNIYPLIRIDVGQGGHEYLLLDIALSGPEKGKIQDMFVASSGKWSSESIAGASKLLLIKDNSLLQQFFGNIEINEDLGNQFVELGNLRASGQYAEAYKLIMNFPEAIRQDRAIIDVAIQVGQMYRDDAYYFQLGELAKYHGKDPSTQFVLVDHYFIQGDFDNAQKSINQVLDLFGEDAALYNLKANVSSNQQDLASAIEFSQQAIKIEPTFAPAYWTLLTLQSSQNAFADMVKTLTAIEQNLGFDFTENDFMGNNFYTAFLSSQEFKNWMSSKG